MISTPATNSLLLKMNIYSAAFLIFQKWLYNSLSYSATSLFKMLEKDTYTQTKLLTNLQNLQKRFLDPDQNIVVY